MRSWLVSWAVSLSLGTALLAQSTSSSWLDKPLVNWNTAGRAIPAAPSQDESVAEVAAVRRGNLIALDGSSYFSRPGPRVVDGIEMLAEIFDPEAFRDLSPATGWTPIDVRPQ